jgi:hypothetical protein
MEFTGHGLYLGQGAVTMRFDGAFTFMERGAHLFYGQLIEKLL